MTCFIVTYDAATDESNQKILDVIQQYPTHAQISDRAWAVVADGEATDIRDKLNQIISPEDRFFVIRSGEQAGWTNVICEKSWLHKYLMNEY